MKKLVIAAAAILLLAGGAMLAVYVQSGGPGPGAEVLPAPPPAPTNPAADLPPQTQADLSHYGGGTERRAPKPMEYAPAPPPPPVGSWESVKPVGRLANLGPVGHAVNRGIAQLGPQLGACFDETTQARYGQTGYTAAKEEYAAVDENGSTIFMLQLETLDGQVRIVDAPVESRGGASDGLLSCAQSVLRGQTFASPGAKPGSRMRVPYNLAP